MSYIKSYTFPYSSEMCHYQGVGVGLNYICLELGLTVCLKYCFAPGQEDDGRKVLVLSYPQYCRYRSVLARLREQPSVLLTNHTVLALGGIASLHSTTRILYCRDTFEHPTLLQNESVCDEFGKSQNARVQVAPALLKKVFSNFAPTEHHTGLRSLPL